MHGGEGCSLPGSIPPDYTVNSKSLVCIKHGNYGLVIRYHVDEFTCSWSAVHSIAQSHIYPGFTGKLAKLTHFPLEPRHEDYPFF